MEEIKLYSPDGKLLVNEFVDDSSYCLREIMGANELNINFSLPYYIEIKEGSYCDYKGERYYLPRALEYVKQHSANFSYKLILEGSVSRLKATKFKFFDVLREPNKPIQSTSSFKLTFSLTANPKDFVQLLVDNLNMRYPADNWRVGECLESAPVTIDFSHDLCFDVLAKLADAFETEWEVSKNTIHIRKVEHSQESAISLSYGMNKGVLGGITRLQYDSKRIINRVYIVGGDRNIDRSTYGNDTLLLPKNRQIEYKGITYTTDEFGAYLERLNPLSGEEDSLDISKHYPKRIGEVTAVEKIDDKQGFYNIVDNTIPESLDFSKHIIAGETMTIIFQTGQLAGKEFDVKYNHSKRTFEIAPITQNGLIYPQGNIVPAVGDQYAVFHMNMPKEYIETAEEKALQDAVSYLWENEQAQYTYRWTLDGIYAKRHWGEIRGLLECGYFVRFSDPQFLPEPVDVRIVAIKEKINDPQSPEITIANNISSRTFGSVINQIPTQEQATDRKDTELKEYTRRGFRQVSETIDKLIEAGLDFDKAIKPIIVQTMSILVGDESLQFRFVDGKKAPKEVASGIYFNKENKRLICPLNTLQHMTLGIDSISSSHADNEYKFWDVKAYQSDVLTDTAASYYLYLRCSVNDYTDARYLISENAIKMDAESGFYHFLVGIINSEDEGDRSFAELYGFTEILPGRITTNKVISSDGNVFFDLANNVLQAVKNGAGFIWNNGLKILNSIFEVKDSNGETVAKIDEQGNAMFGKGAHKFNADKSLSLGDGNILYDPMENLRITGKFASNKDGNSIVIDPEDRSLKLTDGKTIYSQWYFDAQSKFSAQTFTRDDTEVVITPNYVRSASKNRSAVMFGNTSFGFRYSVLPFTLDDPTKAFFQVVAEEDDLLIIIARKLPTSSIGLRNGQVYLSGDTLKVKLN